jgi:hypothetical protein
MISPDVLALQEIYDNDDEGTTRTNAELDTAFAMLNEEGDADWKYELFPNKGDNDKSQLCGVAWNAKKVNKAGDTLRIDVSDDNDSYNSWDRAPHAIKLTRGSGKTDFVIIPLHMKANTLSGPNARNVAQRGHEAELLVNQIGEIQEHFEDKDVLLIGDTNILTSNESAARKFVGYGFRDLNDNGQGTYVDGKAPFDRVFVLGGRDGREFAFSRQYVLTSCDHDAHKEYISDHHMVVSLIKVMDDDD